MQGRAAKLGKRTAVATGVAVAMAALASCASHGGTDAGSSGCQLKIGVLEPLSGTAASLGVPVVDGAKLAASHANSTKQSKCQVVLDTQDYKSDTSTAVTDAQHLVSDGVYGIIGPNQGSATLAIAPVVNRANVPVCAFNNTIGITGSANSSIFRCQSDDVDNVKASILFLKEQFKAKSIVILHTDDAYGTQAASALTSVANQGNTKISVLDNISFSYEATDITSEWSRAKAHNPDAYVLWGSGSSMAVALRDAAQLGIKAPILGSQGLASQAIIDAAGQAAEGVYAVGLTDPSKTTAEQQTVSQLLQKEHGTGYQPTLYNYIGWDAVQLMIDAYAKNPKDGVDGLGQVGTKQLTVGTYTFSADNRNGLGLNSIWITQVKNGKFVGVKAGLLSGPSQF